MLPKILGVLSASTFQFTLRQRLMSKSKTNCNRRNSPGPPCRLVSRRQTTLPAILTCHNSLQQRGYSIFTQAAKVERQRCVRQRPKSSQCSAAIPFFVTLDTAAPVCVGGRGGSTSLGVVSCVLFLSLVFISSRCPQKNASCDESTLGASRAVVCRHPGLRKEKRKKTALPSIRTSRLHTPRHQNPLTSQP